MTTLELISKPRANGKVYRTSDGLIVKTIPWAGDKSERFLKREEKIQRALLLKGFNVSTPYGVSSLRLNDGAVVSGFFMEYIPGIPWYDLDLSQRDFTSKTIRPEIKRAISMNFKPGNYNENVILGSDGKVYLIDFEYWEMPGVPDEITPFLRDITNRL
ncbi:hypothetical protein HY448_00150 [Candidatus Pacearchaeota archaeon]|nr:hypothetical protein [Candidatus Pacearchaeota archaeon]